MALKAATQSGMQFMGKTVPWCLTGKRIGPRRGQGKLAIMNRRILCVAIFLAFVSLASAQSPRTYRGEVSDSQCALNIHSLSRSHREMLKSKSMGGTANTCSVYCIEHMGGYLVLSVGSNVYRLDRVDLVHGFEGQKVVVTGVLDSKANQIHVLKIDLDQKR